MAETICSTEMAATIYSKFLMMVPDAFWYHLSLDYDSDDIGDHGCINCWKIAIKQNTLIIITRTDAE